MPKVEQIINWSNVILETRRRHFSQDLTSGHSRVDVEGIIHLANGAISFRELTGTSRSITHLRLHWNMQHTVLLTKYVSMMLFMHVDCPTAA